MVKKNFVLFAQLIVLFALFFLQFTIGYSLGRKSAVLKGAHAFSYGIPKEDVKGLFVCPENTSLSYPTIMFTITKEYSELTQFSWQCFENDKKDVYELKQIKLNRKYDR